jgi:hypothetical protein
MESAVSVGESRAYNYETEGYDGPVTYRVYCSGGTEKSSHGKLYDGPSAELALLARDLHRNCVPRIDENVAFMFTTVAGRQEVTARFMSRDELRKTHGGRYTRAYVSIRDVELGDHPPYSMRGDDPENDKAWRAYNRAELNAMKLKLSRVSAVLELAFGKEPGAAWSFSRKAGCSCPCSPGFILRGHRIRVERLPYAGATRTNRVPVDIWVN